MACYFPGTFAQAIRKLQFYLILFIIIIFKFYVFIFSQRGRVGEIEGEKHQCVVASHVALTGDLALIPGMCPDWESNQ